MAIESSRLLVYRSASKVANKRSGCVVPGQGDVLCVRHGDGDDRRGADPRQGRLRKGVPLERMRATKMSQIYEGTNQIQRVVISSAMKRGQRMG